MKNGLFTATHTHTLYSTIFKFPTKARRNKNDNIFSSVIVNLNENTQFYEKTKRLDCYYIFVLLSLGACLWTLQLRLRQFEEEEK